MTAIFEAAVIVLAAAVALAAVSARVSSLAALGGCVLLGAVGVGSAAGWTHAMIDLGGWLGFGHATLTCDRLAGIFFALTGAVGAVVSLVVCERPPSRAVAGLHALILLAVAAVIGADQAFVFLFAWETLTLALFLLGSADGDRGGNLLAAYFATGVNKIGGAAMLAAFALLFGRTGSFDFSVWAHADLGTARSIAGVLLIIGFGSKIGVVPLHEALPALYAAAPGPSAATVAIAFNVGFYGLWRLVYETLGPGPQWWGAAVIILGGFGALVGILSAVVQDRMHAFLGYSSVEHGGIILLGFGVALLGQSVHEPKLAAAGLLAATLHMIMHGIAKPLAFIAADRVRTAAGDRMQPLGGLADEMPHTAIGCGMAVLSLAAMPPFGGFVSEWFTFEALLQAVRLDGTLTRLVMALGAAMLALTAGIGLLAFARLFGGVFLGRRRGPRTVRRERGTSAGIVIFAVALAALGLVAPWEIRWLGHGLNGLLGFNLATTTISHPLVLGPVYPGFSVLSPTWLTVAIPAFLTVTAVVVRLLLRPVVRRAPIWTSGSAPGMAAVQYTPGAYVNPIRVVLSGAYGFNRMLRSSPANTGSRELVTRTVPAFHEYLYRPLTERILRLSDRARRVQSGRLAHYLTYVLIVLIVILALIPTLKA